ncbi:MAG TPA: SHOCT domain-containing protein [Mucilaginibacter sp.]|jgi:putative membrane protein|nr:SHOCT domain-containing protein [Mucilaginibacter sp.]
MWREYLNYYFLGMHLFWWIFWYIFLFVMFFTPYEIPGSIIKKHRDPLYILKRRLVSGEITKEEYQILKNFMEGEETGHKKKFHVPENNL